METLKMPSREQIKEAACTCPQARDTLERLFPSVFEKPKEWRNISNEIKLKRESSLGNKGFFIELWWGGLQIGFVSPTKSEAVNFYFGITQDCKDHEFKHKSSGDIFEIHARKL